MDRNADDFNIQLAESTELADATNARFYGRFQFPRLPAGFDCPSDADFERVMLNQGVGSWDHSVVPRNPRIWVAGCGTNQAVYTALRFPNAAILGSDLSAESLGAAAKAAEQMGLSNLELRQESINGVDYRDEFDYIICTGVIHHNADPSVSLQRLAGALKPTGILELMVYNRYHRIATTAFQKAIRILGGDTGEAAFDRELAITRKIITSTSGPGLMAKFLSQFEEVSEPELADALLQPIEHSYTVESLDSLAARCGLELIAPCISQFDKANQTLSWNIEFSDPDLESIYESLPDRRRWQVSNCLMLEKSPMLWFYVSRTDSGVERRSEMEMCEGFLSQRFARSATKKKVYVRADGGGYQLSSQQPVYPGMHPDALCGRIISSAIVRPTATMRDLLADLKVETKFSNVNRLRLLLTTSAFPYLIARQ